MKAKQIAPLTDTWSNWSALAAAGQLPKGFSIEITDAIPLELVVIGTVNTGAYSPGQNVTGATSGDVATFVRYINYPNVFVVNELRSDWETDIAPGQRIQEEPEGNIAFDITQIKPSYLRVLCVSEYDIAVVGVNTSDPTEIIAYDFVNNVLLSRSFNAVSYFDNYSNWQAKASAKQLPKGNFIGITDTLNEILVNGNYATGAFAVNDGVYNVGGTQLGTVVKIIDSSNIVVGNLQNSWSSDIVNGNSIVSSDLSTNVFNVTATTNSVLLALCISETNTSQQCYDSNTAADIVYYDFPTNTILTRSGVIPSVIVFSYTGSNGPFQLTANKRHLFLNPGNSGGLEMDWPSSPSNYDWVEINFKDTPGGGFAVEGGTFYTDVSTPFLFSTTIKGIYRFVFFDNGITPQWYLVGGDFNNS